MIMAHRHPAMALDRPRHALESRCADADVLTAARKDSISGLGAEYMVAMDVTGAGFPADAWPLTH